MSEDACSGPPEVSIFSGTCDRLVTVERTGLDCDDVWFLEDGVEYFISLEDFFSGLGTVLIPESRTTSPMVSASPTKAPANRPVHPPAKTPEAPVQAPVKAPVQAPVKAPVKVPVKAPVKRRPLRRVFAKYRRNIGKQLITRHLVESNEDCVNNKEGYDMFLVSAPVLPHGGVHFAYLATPRDMSKNCSSVVFHAQIKGDSPELTKTCLQLHEDDLLDLDEEDTLLLGRMSLIEIVNAFEAAPASKEGEMYDVISNNCALLLRNMAELLGVAVDERMVQFVTNKLTTERASAHVVEMIGKSPAFKTLYDGSRRLLSTEDLIAKVIQLYV